MSDLYAVVVLVLIVFEIFTIGFLVGFRYGLKEVDE